MSAPAAPAGFEVREISTPAELHGVVDVFAQVWGSTVPLVGVELLRAVAHTGGYVAGAIAPGGRLVGASFGLLARHGTDAALHSHVTGVLADVRDTGVGRRLKEHQRAWAAAHDLTWVTWTFDPLVRRNAWFNLRVLGARAEAYLVDFYGPLTDAINHADESDRVLVAWPTAGPPSSPSPRHPDGSAGPLRTVATPVDIVALRAADPVAARRWRRDVRARLGGAMAAGAAVVGFTRDGDYQLTADPRTG